MSTPALEPRGAGEPARRREVDRTRAFFGPRAAGWEDRFPDDGPRYGRAVAELAAPVGGAVLDAGCGTGRALPFLRSAVGPAGVVAGADLTPQMLREAQQRHPAAGAALVLGDVLRLPFAAGAFDAVFAAGLISHLRDPHAGLSELARVCRGGARLALFHPIGRATLARRHGRELTPDDVRSEPNIRALLDRAGWRCAGVDDAEDRYLVLATRG
jgi:SAM-dependent methyltransferase